MRAVCDSGPLLAAIDRRDEAHDLAAQMVDTFGRNLLIPTPVIAEVDHLARSRVGDLAARAFLESLDDGTHTVAFLSPGLIHEAIGWDSRLADLKLGFTDGCVMAIAERERLPILTFDFEDFRATKPAHGHWKLVIDEARYAEVVRAR